MTTGGETPADARLIIDLAAIRRNWLEIRNRIPAGARAGAVVKADAYGLGMAQIAPLLAAAGCKDFFVATLDEGVGLRGILPEADITVLNGCPAGSEADLVAANLRPALNDLGAIERWREQARRTETALPAVIHLDTGMARLGLSPGEVARLAEEPDRLAGLAPSLVMSHLACADEAQHPMNGEQLARFRTLRQSLPAMPASLAASSGVFLGPDYAFDLVRPGAALYGINPTPWAVNPMVQVLHLKARIVALREIDAPLSVGYGATYRASGKTRIATVPIGYADGYPRALGNQASGYLANGDASSPPLPVVGRVSMDLVTLDVSAVPPDQVGIGTVITLIGPHCTLDTLAAESGTIGYELLVRLGRRVPRSYIAEAIA
ncbi:MAG: alanine racemase [Alphaproteobacteria bacterium]|nr:alanine racemase [Alphaproteobacteria bacterium]